MMNQRENFFAMLNGQKPDYSPVFFQVYKSGMRIGHVVDHPLISGGVDCFGVKWVGTEGTMPEPNNFMFEDISEWKNYVKFPDLDAMDLASMAALDLEGFDPNTQVFNAMSHCGVFERLAAFMGFENALMAMAEDPESCMEFFEAIADFKIKLHNKMIDLYHPDVITYFDDIATVRGTFMSPEMYREQIKPFEKKIAQACIDRGVIFCYHVCGYVEEVINDIVDLGTRIWHSAQSCNDLVKIQKKYGHRLLIEGGWDSQGPASRNDATKEQWIEEAIRCAETYAPYGNFTLFPILLNEKGNALAVGDDRLPAMLEAYNTHTIIK